MELVFDPKNLHFIKLRIIQTNSTKCIQLSEIIEYLSATIQFDGAYELTNQSAILLFL